MVSPSEAPMRPLVPLLVALSACGPQISGFDYKTNTEEFQQASTDEVDILWVVDNSNSMELEQSLLASGFTSFATALEDSNSDFHIGVVTTDFDYEDLTRGQLVDGFIDRSDPNYVQTFADRAQIGINGSGKEKGLEAAAYALSPAMTQAGAPNAGFLRPSANLLVIVVSDEEDCSDNGALGVQESEACYTQPEKLTPVSEFVTAFRDLKTDASKVKFSAIVGPEEATGICDETSVPGRRYIEVANYLGGLVSSICESDWSSILGELGLNASGVLTTFQLEHGARDGTLEVTVDGATVPVSEFDGYTYDAEFFTVTFHGAAIPPRGSTIVIRYEIEPGT
jgi:hypothetical protein